MSAQPEDDDVTGFAGPESWRNPSAEPTRPPWIRVADWDRMSATARRQSNQVWRQRYRAATGPLPAPVVVPEPERVAGVPSSWRGFTVAEMREASSAYERWCRSDRQGPFLEREAYRAFCRWADHVRSLGLSTRDPSNRKAQEMADASRERALVRAGERIDTARGLAATGMLTAQVAGVLGVTPHALRRMLRQYGDIGGREVGDLLDRNAKQDMVDRLLRR